MKMKQIIDDIEKTIREEVDNPDDVEGYVENCLLYDISGGAEYYKITENQFRYCVYRASIRI